MLTLLIFEVYPLTNKQVEELKDAKYKDLLSEDILCIPEVFARENPESYKHVVPICKKIKTSDGFVVYVAGKENQVQTSSQVFYDHMYSYSNESNNNYADITDEIENDAETIGCIRYATESVGGIDVEITTDATYTVHPPRHNNGRIFYLATWDLPGLVNVNNPGIIY